MAHVWSMFAGCQQGSTRVAPALGPTWGVRCIYIHTLVGHLLWHGGIFFTSYNYYGGRPPIESSVFASSVFDDTAAKTCQKRRVSATFLAPACGQKLPKWRFFCRVSVKWPTKGPAERLAKQFGLIWQIQFSRILLLLLIIRQRNVLTISANFPLTCQRRVRPISQNFVYKKLGQTG